MSSINSIGGARPSALSASGKPAELEKSEPAPWKRTEAGTGREAKVPRVSPDKLPPWVAAAAQQIAGFAERQLPGPYNVGYNLGVYIGNNIRTFMDSHGELRADIAALLQHPAVLAAAATVAPRIIGALAMNQLAFNAPPQAAQHLPA